LLQATVDGLPMPLHSLWYFEMNFGQLREDWGVPATYELTVPRSEFIERLEPSYLQLVAELQADEPNDPDGAPYLREIGYPPLALLLDHPRQFFAVVEVFLYDDVFRRFLSGCSSPTFWINSVDEVQTRADTVSLRGRGYPPRPDRSWRELA
jgi:hypothetical protein